MENLIEFAENIYTLDIVEMQKEIDFENYVKPLFKIKFNKEYRTEYLSMYTKEYLDFIDIKKLEFIKL